MLSNLLVLQWVKKAFQTACPADLDVMKLHRQFGHPSDEQLQTLLVQAGMDPEEAKRKTLKVQEKCKDCAKIRPPIGAPLVGRRVWEQFNDCVELDLWYPLAKRPVLSMYDRGQGWLESISPAPF